MTKDDILDTLGHLMDEYKELSRALEKICKAMSAFASDTEYGGEYTDYVISEIGQIATRYAKAYLDHDKRTKARDEER